MDIVDLEKFQKKVAYIIALTAVAAHGGRQAIRRVWN